MKSFFPIFLLCLVLCFVFSGCGQANSVPLSTAEPAQEQMAEATPVPTPELIDYEALAIKLNGDIVSPVDEVEAKIEEAEAKEELETSSNNPGAVADVETNNGTVDAAIDADRIQNALISGGVFEAGEDNLIYRFWSAGIDKELIDLIGSDGTESSRALYSELLNSFIANYDALQKAVVLYEEDAVLALHVVESSEAVDPIIVVENGKITYDYGTAQGYFVSEAPVGDTPLEEATG